MTTRLSDLRLEKDRKMTKRLSDLRKEYHAASKDERLIQPDPLLRFDHWFNESLDSGRGVPFGSMSGSDTG